MRLVNIRNKADQIVWMGNFFQTRYPVFAFGVDQKLF